MDYKKEWYLRNKERLHQKYMDNRDYYLQKSIEYQRTHKEQRKEYLHKKAEEKRLSIFNDPLNSIIIKKGLFVKFE